MDVLPDVLPEAPPDVLPDVPPRVFAQRFPFGKKSWRRAEKWCVRPKDFVSQTEVLTEWGAVFTEWDGLVSIWC